jgi:hypothetical protein
MGRRAAGGLVAKPEPETLKVQIARDLVEQMAILDQRIAKEAPAMQFDRSAVVEDALRAAVRKANQTLDGCNNRSTT